MRLRLVTRLLWSIAAFLTGLFVWLVWLDRGDHGTLGFDIDPLFTALFALLMLAFPTMAVPIIRRQPSNPIGWMFYATGLTLAIGTSARVYSDLALYKLSLPGGAVTGWVASWIASMGLIASPIFLMFLFPTGRPLSIVWRRILIALAALAVITYVGFMFEPGPLDSDPLVANPFGIEGPAASLLRFLSVLNNLIVVPASILGMAALVTRFRRAEGVERQQLKWFVFIGSITLAAFVLTFLFGGFGLDVLADVFFAVAAVSLLALPAVVVLAMLRYRLYEIDRLISRTVSYGLLSALLVGIYVGSVMLLRRLAPFQGQLAVAASTLASAALFNPLRRSVQTVVDRRFNRARLDHERTIEAFALDLQTESDLSRIEHRLSLVAAETVQPAQLAVWIRPA